MVNKIYIHNFYMEYLVCALSLSLSIFLSPLVDEGYLIIWTWIEKFFHVENIVFFYFYKKLISSFRCLLLRLTHSGPLVIPINCLIKSQCTQQCLRFQPCWFQTTSWNFRKRIKRIPVLLTLNRRLACDNIIS